MPFNTGQILVFDRTGARVGTLTGWSVSTPRSYKVNEVDDFQFVIPLKDYAGNTVLDAAMDALLVRDNVVFIENQLNMKPWAGPISEVEYKGDVATVSCLSGMHLLAQLESATVTQSGGSSYQMAAALVGAAQAKQAAHGDITMAFTVDGTTPSYGIRTYSGDILSALQTLADDTTSEFWVEPLLAAGSQSISFLLHWNARIQVDKTSVILSDGPGGNIAPGAAVKFSGLEVVNRIRLVGAQTSLSNYVDYSCVGSIIKDVAPEVELILDNNPTQRRKENLSLSVDFGYSEDTQRGMVVGWDDGSGHHYGLQEKYVNYYKTFLYALHNRAGKPFLDGFDWRGPDGVNEKKLTERYFRTLNKLGRIGAATIVTTTTADDAQLAVDPTSWSFNQNVPTLALIDFASGMASNYTDQASHWVADLGYGGIYSYNPVADVPYELLITVAYGAFLLVGVASDPTTPTTVWALLSDGTDSVVNSYDVTTGDLLTTWTVTGTAFNDIDVDYANGKIYMATSSSSTVQVRHISDGSLFSPDQSFDTGLAGGVAGFSRSNDIGYAISPSGEVKLIFLANNSVGGEFSTGVSASGIYVDRGSNQVNVILVDGSINIYDAQIAVGNIPAPGDTTVGSPGFDEIISGQFVHIVMTSDAAYVPAHTSTSGSTYTVKSGDTLWGIALRYYGSGSSYPTIYKANKAVIDATAQSHGFTSDFPHWIFPGEVLTIPGVGGKTTPAATSGATKYWFTYSKGAWVTQIVPGPIGSPSSIQKEWVIDGDQLEGHTDAAHCEIQDPAVVILGEEGRVCDWEPVRDGYGLFKEEQLYRTQGGRSLLAGPGWYPHAWDVPDSEWLPEQPVWEEGVAYLTEYLNRHNKEVTVQTIQVINKDNVWEQIELGGIYTLNLTLQGPRPVGLSLSVRVLAYSPNELTGYMDLVTEVV